MTNMSVMTFFLSIKSVCLSVVQIQSQGEEKMIPIYKIPEYNTPNKSSERRIILIKFTIQSF